MDLGPKPTTFSTATQIRDYFKRGTGGTTLIDTSKQWNQLGGLSLREALHEINQGRTVTATPEGEPPDRITNDGTPVFSAEATTENREPYN